VEQGSGVLQHKAAIEARKDRWKVTMDWRAYNSPALFRTVPFQTAYGIHYPKIGGSQPQPKTAIAIISWTGKATDCKFGRYIHRVHLNKIHYKFWILEKRERGHIRGLPNFLVPPIISGMGKATNFKFCAHIHRIDRNRSPLKFSAKVAVGVLRDSRKFSGHPCIGRIARSSLR